MKITNFVIFTAIFISIQVFNLITLLDLNFFLTRQIYSTVFMLLVPGALISMTLKIKTNDFWRSLIFTIGLSLFYLMFSGFLTNQLFSYFEFDKPLSLMFYIVIFNLCLYPFFFAAYFRNKDISLKLKIGNFKYIDLLFFNFPLFFPVLSYLGAVSLNNYSYNPFTITMLGLIGVWIFLVFIFHKAISRNVLISGLLFISLSLLLSTSLRGWYITGHDIQSEYYVFQLSKNDYKWDIAEYRDPYNASLSITILPTVFETVLKINEIYVYKVIYQIIFSFIAVSLYLFFEKYSSKFVSFMSVVAFLSFPSFITDLPMLNRQEIATYLFSAMLLALFSPYFRNLNYKIMALMFGFSMVVSHYSTTYISIALFASVYAINLALRLFPFKINFIKSLATPPQKQRVTLLFILALIGFTLFWNVQLTNTTQSLTRIFNESVNNIGRMFNQDLKSGSTTYNILSSGSLDKEELFEDYKKSQTERARQRSNSENLFEENLTKNYETRLVEEYRRPVTDLGKILERRSINTYDLNYYMRQIAAKLVQLFLILGIVILFFKRRILNKKFEPEYLLLVISALITILLFIALPVLSLEYGTQRLFQQALVVGALPLVIGFMSSFGKTLTKLFVILIYFSLSGFLPYITGGYYPQLHLENEGSYYESFVTFDSEYNSLNWLKQNYDSRFDVYASPNSRSRIAAMSGIFTARGLLPEIVTKSDYVYLNKINVSESVDLVSHRGDLVVFTLPLKFFDENKDLIYDNKETKIYK